MDAIAWIKEKGFQLQVQDCIYNDIVGVTVSLCSKTRGILLIPAEVGWALCQGHGKNLTEAMSEMLRLMMKYGKIQNGFESETIPVPGDLTLPVRVVLSVE